MARGDAFFSPAVAKILLDEARYTGARTPRGSPQLTDREIQVLKLVAEGCSSPEIARRLKLSVKTVEAPRQRIKGKLGLRTGAQLVQFAANWAE